LDREQVEFLSAGRSLVETCTDLLAQKMGILRQNLMMMRLIRSAVAANIYRAGNRGSADALLSTDTLALGVAHSARARLRTIGGKPISHRLSGTGSPIDGYLMYASDQAMLPIRNDSTFNTVQATAGDRGKDNVVFTGELLNWGGMPWYEHPIIDESWDDYIGNPMLAKAKIAVAFNSDTAKYALDGNTSLFLRGSAATTFSLASPRYFQFFKGYDYRFVQSTDDEALNPDAGTYYAWAINPDGTCAFISYTGSNNKGTYVQITSILSDLAGTSTLGATQVGNVKLGTAIPVKATVNGLTRIITGGTGHNISAGFSRTLLTDRVDVGAILLQANAARCGRRGSVGDDVRSRCPFCTEKPVAAVVRPEGDGGKRFLLCWLCFTEWGSGDGLCPHCGETSKRKLRIYTDEEFPHIRVEACDTCRVYLKLIDLTRDGRAVPDVDELASVVLDLWAAKHGYTKLQTNLFGM
ncbi:MAG: formate dehydrogenase accessory protein FdhE, partial [Candidatus Solibacter sp.]|nr:formate dehydrogenase accessory protein FdhE [Candidatus Solibacter sp.]